MIDRSEIFTSAHRFAKALVATGGWTYRNAFATGLRAEYADLADLTEQTPAPATVEIVNQASIQSRLTRAARNAETIGQRAATFKQIGYLASLMFTDVAKFGPQVEPAVNDSNFVLTSREASRLINVYAH